MASTTKPAKAGPTAPAKPTKSAQATPATATATATATPSVKPVAAPTTSVVVARVPDMQVAAFERPTTLTEMTLDAFDVVVRDFTARGGPVIAAMKRAAGILAWAARHQYPDSHYGAWLHQFAEQLGFHEDSITRWRDQAVSELGLALPQVTQDRSRARLAGAATQLRRKAEQAAAPSPARAAAVAALTAVPSAGPFPDAPIILGSIGPAPIRAALASLLAITAEVLADSATTADLERLRDAIQQAIIVQKRISLHARLALRREPTG